MNRNSLRLFIAVFALVVIIIGLITGRLREAYQESPGTMVFIVLMLLVYSAFTLHNAVKNRHKK